MVPKKLSECGKFSILKMTKVEMMLHFVFVPLVCFCFQEEFTNTCNHLAAIHLSLFHQSAWNGGKTRKERTMPGTKSVNTQNWSCLRPFDLADVADPPLHRFLLSYSGTQPSYEHTDPKACCSGGTGAVEIT